MAGWFNKRRMVLLLIALALAALTLKGLTRGTYCLIPSTFLKSDELATAETSLYGVVLYQETGTDHNRMYQRAVWWYETTLFSIWAVAVIVPACTSLQLDGGALSQYHRRRLWDINNEQLSRRTQNAESIAMRVKRFVIASILLLLTVGSAFAQSAAPLADAAEKKDRVKVAALLKQGADVNASQADGMTALHWATFHDDVSLATQFLKAGANAKAANRYGISPLSLACTNGNAEIVELLLKAGADANTTVRGGETVLMTAARTGKPGPVKALLSHGAQVNAKDRKGQTALMWAAAEGHAEVVSLLLAAKADFKSPLPSGFTPLLFAAREGRTDVVRVLLKAGADINDVIPDKKGGPRGPKPGTGPLLMAVENGHFELAIALVKAGADPNDQRAGYGALHMVSWVRKPGRGDNEEGDPPPIGSGKLTSLEFVKEMIANGAKVNLPSKTGLSGRGILDKPGATPFLAAASTADVPLMELLIKLGADPLLANSQRTTPLLAAAGVGVGAPEEAPGAEPEVLGAVKLLLNLKADVNAVDDNGETALHGAAYRNHPKVVQLLADKGTKIAVWNKANKAGLTPLVIAEGHRPGLNFRPSPETVAALHRVMLAAGVTPPKSSLPSPKSGYEDGKKK